MTAFVVGLAFLQDSLFQRVIGAPTGKNGYEEYIQACDLANQMDLAGALEALTAERRSDSLLERQRAVAKKCAAILPLIRQGNTKTASYPTSLSFESRIYESAPLRTIGYAMVVCAQVDFADGRVNQGISTLLDALVYSNRISFLGPLIFDLIGRLIENKVVQSVSDNIALVSLPSAWDMGGVVTQLDDGRNAWLVAVQIELHALIPEVLDRFDDPKLRSTIAEESTIAELESLSKPRLDALKKELGFALKRHLAELQEVAKLPEADWIPAAEKSTTSAVPQDPIASKLYSGMTVSWRLPLKLEIVRRTRLRLLRVVSKLVEMKWSNGQLPVLLSQLPDPSIALDPLTGRPFQYQRTPGGFEIYSEGTADTGKIGLTPS